MCKLRSIMLVIVVSIHNNLLKQFTYVQTIMKVLISSEDIILSIA